MDKRKIALYMRLSYADEEVRTAGQDESNSIEHQRELLYSYLSVHPELNGEVIELKDDGYTGTDLNRPQLQALLNMVYEKQIGTIIVKDFSRLGRNYLDIGYLTDLIFPSFGVRLISVNDHHDSLKDAESTGGMDVALKNIANQFYSMDLSKKMKSARDILLSQGRHMGGIPFGYIRGASKGILVIDEPAAEIVRMVFQLSAEQSGTVSCAKVARILNERHIISPSMYRKRNGNGSVARSVWTSASVYNILSNVTYTGNMIKYQCHKPSVSSKALVGVPRSEWEIIPNTHEALVSQELYDTVWNRIRHVRKTEGVKKQQRRRSVLDTVLRCCYCGSALKPKQMKPFQYWCSSAYYCDDTCKCRSVICDPDELEVVILDTLNKMAAAAAEEIGRAKQESASLEKQNKALGKRRIQLAKELTSIKNERQKLFERFVAGEISQEEFLATKSSLRVDEQRLECEQGMIQEKQNQLQRQQEEQKQAKKSMTVYKPVEKLTKQTVRQYIKRITIYPDRNPEITFNFKDCFKE